MAVIWQTIEEAALTLGVSSRTLHRRIAKGEFPTRMESGRREVQLFIVDPPPPAPQHAGTERSGVPDSSSATSANPFENPTGASESRQTVSDDPIGTVLALHEDRIRRTDLAILAYQQSVATTATEARRAQRNSYIGWGVAGGAILLMFIAMIWTTYSLTRSKADVDHLNQAVRQLSDTADTSAKQAARFREDAETARIAAAKAQGALDAARSEITSVKASLDRALEEKSQADAARQASAILSATAFLPISPATPPPTTAPAQLLTEIQNKPVSP